MNWHQHIHLDPAICKRRPCITRSRITVGSVLDNLADGMTVDAIVASPPSRLAALSGSQTEAPGRTAYGGLKLG